MRSPAHRPRAWVRGHETDFDLWAKVVNDDRWSYKSLLPCFRRSETHYEKQEACENAEEHGFDGPIHTVCSQLMAFMHESAPI